MEFGVVSGDGSVVEVSPRALDRLLCGWLVGTGAIRVVVGGFCARVVGVAVVDGG
jgi:hypothetical protein